MSKLQEKRPLPQESAGTGDQRTPRPRKGPLAGIRIADFCWAGVGALATRLLADFGAEVIKIEDRNRLDIMRRVPIYKGQQARGMGDEDTTPDPDKSGIFNNYNRSKLGVTINMRTKRGRELCERLIAQCSVVTENFAPEIMERWGLTYDRLKELRPDVIFGRMSGFGHSGPDGHYRSYGPVAQAVSGLSYIGGLPGKEPSGWGFSYMDNQAAYCGSAALMTAIYHRNRTGKGTEIDASAVEAGIRFIGPLMLDVTVNNRSTRTGDFPLGNRVEYVDAAPHGVYPSSGEDRWVAITIFNDEEWSRFVAAIGNPEWSHDPRFANQGSRHRNQDALDEFVASWTRTRSPHEAANLLQGHKVRAGAVQTIEDLVDHDRQIAHRKLYFKLDHPVIGDGLFEGVPIHFSGMKADNWRSAPLIGEDNDYVCKDILAMTDEEIAELKAEGIL